MIEYFTARELAAQQQVQAWLDGGEPGFEAVRIAFKAMQRELDALKDQVVELQECVDDLEGHTVR